MRIIMFRFPPIAKESSSKTGKNFKALQLLFAGNFYLASYLTASKSLILRFKKVKSLKKFCRAHIGTNLVTKSLFESEVKK